MVIVPGRHGCDSAVWWIDAHNRSVEVAGRRTLYVDIVAHGASVGTRRLVLLDETHQRWLLVARGLPEASEITVKVGLSAVGPWSTLTTRTLASKPASFTLATGSCFALGHDPDGVVASGYRKLTAHCPVDLRVLSGDQIYMDRDPVTGEYFGLLDGAPYTEPPVRPMERYERQWRDARWSDFVAATPTLYLGDDHEFWNDYPRIPRYLQYPKLAEAAKSVDEFTRAFDVFQSSLNASPDGFFDDPDAEREAVLQGRWRSLSMEAPFVSLMLIDARTQRQRPGPDATFTSPSNLAMLRRWAKELTRPGVLFISQPLSEAPPKEHMGVDFDGAFDSALRHFSAQYRALCEALAEAPRDVLIVSGDVHWSRLRALDLTRKGAPPRRVYEFVSSNLTECLPGEPESDGALDGGIGTWIQCANADKKLVRLSEKFGLATLTFRKGVDGRVDVDASLWCLATPSAPRITTTITLA